jgi:hypothetical protein
MSAELPLQLLGIHTPKGARIHLYDLEGERRYTLCNRWIGVNSRHLGLGGPSAFSADLADCARCRKLASTL